MANWNNPTLTSLYVDFLAELKARDVDVLTMNPGTNIPVGSKRWNAPTNTFQSWDGATWNNLILSGAGGGTGSGAFPTLGTMAAQNANAVAITGGTISGVNLDAGAIVSGILALNRGGTGASLALGAAGSFLQSNGSQVVFGTSGAALTGLNASNITAGNLPAAQMPTGGTWNLPALLEINNASYVRFLSGGIIVGPIAYMGAGAINAQAIFINGVPLATGAGIPTGLMAFFSGACPGGWTHVASSNGRVVRNIGGGTGGFGGADSHQHAFELDPANTADQAINAGLAIGEVSGSGAPSGRDVGLDSGSGVTGWLAFTGTGGQHTHTIGHTHNFTVPGQQSFPGVSKNTFPAESWPPFVEYSLCRKD